MKCEICGETLASNRDLLGHLRVKHAIDPIAYYEANPTAEKFCSKCKKSLPITNFLSDKSNNYGYRTQCITCMKPDGANRMCPVCSRVFKWSAVINHMKVDHGIPPKEGFNKYLKEKYCPKCKQVKKLDHFAKLQDPEKVFFSWCNECNMERNIARNIADQDFDLFQYLVVRLAFSDKCFLCNVSHDESIDKYSEPLHIDHMMAFAKGGALSFGNVILLCKTCNLKKGTKELDEILRESGLTNKEIENRMRRLSEIQAWAEVELKRVLLRHNYKNYPNNAINTDI